MSPLGGGECQSSGPNAAGKVSSSLSPSSLSHLANHSYRPAGESGVSLVLSCQWELLFEVEGHEGSLRPGPAVFLARVSQHCSLTQSKPLQPLHYLSQGLSSMRQQSSVQLAGVGGQPRFGARISSRKEDSCLVSLPSWTCLPGCTGLACGHFTAVYFCPCVTLPPSQMCPGPPTTTP